MSRYVSLLLSVLVLASLAHGRDLPRKADRIGKIKLSKVRTDTYKDEYLIAVLVGHRKRPGKATMNHGWLRVLAVVEDATGKTWFVDVKDLDKVRSSGADKYIGLQIEKPADATRPRLAGYRVQLWTLAPAMKDDFEETLVPKLVEERNSRMSGPLDAVLEKYKDAPKLNSKELDQRTAWEYFTK